jgi:hypothetical protein
MKFILIFALSILLTACSQQPNEADIKEAVKVSIKESNEQVKQMQNALTQEKVADSKKEDKNTENDDKDNGLNSALEQLDNALGKMQSVVKSTVDPAFDLMIFEFVDLQKLGDCEQQKEEKKYKCKIKITVKNKAGSSTNTTDLILIRSESGKWVALDE